MKVNIQYKQFDISQTYQHCCIGYPFRIFFNLNGDNKSPKKLTFNKHKKIPDYIINTFTAFYEAFVIFTKNCELKNPLKEGIYFEKGARFIDILIDDIPTQKGLVSGELINNEYYFSDEKNFHGQSIKIILDKNLIDNTATPIHELFHVFQYNYCNFNNMWFMEGLARWAQNLTHKRVNKEEKLPQTQDELNSLLNRLHDAEYFWRRLFFFIKNKREFIKVFLQECEKESLQLENILKYKKNFWTKEEKKFEINNRYILKATLKSLEQVTIKNNNELTQYVKTIQNYIQNINNKIVLESLTISSEEQLKKYDDIEEVKGDLIIAGKEIKTLNGFNRLKKINTLIIKDLAFLESINGFNSIESVQNIEINNNKNLKEIFGFFKLFKHIGYIEKSLKVTFNKELEDCLFLNGLKKVGASLYLHHNNLKNIDGLKNLEEVGASLSLSSNAIFSLKSLNNLKIVKGMLGIAYNQITSLEGLENLKIIGVAKWNGEYRSLALQGNAKLEDLRYLENMKSMTNHLIIYLNNTDYQCVPPNNANFYKQSIALKNDTLTIETKKIFPLYKATIKLKILFHLTWTKAIKNNQWLEPYFVDFKNIKEVISFAKKHGIIYIYGQVAKAQNFLIKNLKILKKEGFKLISNSKNMVQTFTDKREFYLFMIENGMSEYIPRLYTKLDEVKFPAIIKKESGGNGRDMEIVYNKEQLQASKVNGVINEYIRDKIEYASHIFFKDNKVLFSKTYKKTSQTDYYIMVQDTGNDVIFETIETPFVEVFSKIIEKLDNKYVFCCIDYKIVDNKPKIFEINARLGYTLVKNSSDFKELITKYILECDNE